MRVRDIKDVRDLKDMSATDAFELLDELKAIFSKQATDLTRQGRDRARKALGVPDQGAISAALIGGIVAGVIVGALMAIVFAPFSGAEARRRLGEQVDRMRERAEATAGGNGQTPYPHRAPASPVTGVPVGPATTEA